MTIFTPRIDPPLALLPWSSEYMNRLANKHRTEFIRWCTSSTVFTALAAHVILNVIPPLLASFPATQLAVTAGLILTLGIFIVNVAIPSAIKSRQDYLYFNNFAQQENSSTKLSHKEFLESEWSVKIPYSIAPIEISFENQRILDQQINETIVSHTPKASKEDRIKLKQQIIDKIKETGIINRRKLEHCPVTHRIAIGKSLEEPEILSIAKDGKLKATKPPKSLPFSTVSFRVFLEEVIKRETSFSRQ